MKQQLHSYGEHRNLVGISCTPAEHKHSVGILLLNSGVVHKVGPFSLNRVLSDHLCAQGFFTFRFDFAGLGDSVRVNQSLDYASAVLADATATLDFIQNRFGIDKVVIIGLCTGAENAYRIALQDTRIAGNVWLDGYGYDSLRGTVARVAKRYLSFRRVMLYLGKISRGRVRPDFPADPAVDEYQWTLPPRQELADNLDLLHERGVRFLNIYSGGVLAYNAYRGQFSDTFRGRRFLSAMEIEYYPQADHTYKILADREKLLERILAWLETHW